MIYKKFIIPALFLTLLSPLQADQAAGKAAYITCSACHKADGLGLAVGDKKMAPSLANSKVVNGDPSVLALTVLKGIKKEGTEYIGMMAPLEALYKDDQKLADLLTYVRSSFGNSSSAVSPAEVAKFRTQWAKEKGPVSRARIKELSK